MEFRNPEDLKANMNTGNPEHDRAVSYAVLNKDIQFTEVEQTPVQQEEPIVEPSGEQLTVEQSEQTQELQQGPQDQDNTQEQSSVDPYYDELKQKEEYIQFTEERHTQEKEELLRAKAELEERLRRESEQKEDLARQIRERMQVEQNFTSTSESANDDDDEYVSDHSKKTRQMVIDLERKYRDHPDIQKLVAEFTELRSEIDSEKQERDRIRQEQKRKAAKESSFNDAREFFIKHPEIKPSRDIAEIDADVQRFKRDIGHLSGAKSLADIERAVDDFYSNSEFRKLAESRGIKPVDGYEQYNQYADLKDMAEGRKYNRTTGQFEEIRDSRGNPVRYRSVEEAYILSNYANDITQAKRDMSRKIQKTLSMVNDGPVTLNSSETAKVTNEMSHETIRELMNLNPRVWVNNPQLKEKVEQAYNAAGQPLPKYPGSR